MTEQLTGYEASSVAEIEAILDAMPADADTVYLDTIGYSERAIAAVAAKRAGGGGSTPPTARGSFTGGGPGGSFDPTIANNDVDFLGWGAVDIPNTVVDLTDPFHPAVLVSGIYAVSVSVLPYDMTPSGYYKVIPGLGENAGTFQADADSRLATAAQPTPECHSSMTWYIDAGDTISVRVRNRDGSSAQRFSIDVATIQRVT